MAAPSVSPAPTIHATCVCIGDTGILIRGASGAGKSRLALRLILDPPRVLPCAMLVADDRVFLSRSGEQLMAQAPDVLAGLIEVRGLGIRRLPFLSACAVSLVVDLGAADATRLPCDEGAHAILEGKKLSRVAVSQGDDAALLIAAALHSEIL